MATETLSADQVATILGNESRRPRWHVRWLAIAAGVSLAMAVGAVAFWTRGQQADVQYRTQIVQRGDLTSP